MMNFKTLNDLNLAIATNLSNIAKLKPDLVVAVPVSGMIPASIIATSLQIPFTDVEGYLNNRYYDFTGKKTVANNLTTTRKNVLLVDASINSGKAMKGVVDCLLHKKDNIIRFAVFGSPKNTSTSVDFTCETVGLPRMFQWDIWKHPNLIKCATDMDGVLCRDPSQQELKRDLRKFLHITEPLYPIKKTVKFIITARKEIYRQETEEWLQKNNIPYEHLVMKPTSYKESDKVNADYKAEVINRYKDNIKLYIESNDIQANRIAELVPIPVWCTDSQKIYNIPRSS